MGKSLPTTAFVRDVHGALQHLFDPGELRRNPLLALLGLDQREDPLTSLRRLLLESIRSLKPGPDVPAQSNAWRVYHILSQRYAEQFSQQEVASDLSLSIRQLRRHETRAVRALADYLWSRHNLQIQEAQDSSKRLATSSVSQAGHEGAPSREQELEWLRRSFPSERAEVGELIQAALKTIAPLMQVSGARVSCSVPDNLPGLAVQLAPIRQSLLNLLAAAVRCAPGGKVLIEAQRRSWNVIIRICPSGCQVAAPALSEEDTESLEMARQLARLAGGSLELLPGDGKQHSFSAQLTLSAAEQVAVLVIDDNADTLRLVQRYLSDTRYRFVAAPDPEPLLAADEGPGASIIVLDVMLPGVDGWELLGRLREHPRTRSIPVVVCTILPQQGLALALGAAAFLRKPVSRQELLAVLDQQVELLARESW